MHNAKENLSQGSEMSKNLLQNREGANEFVQSEDKIWGNLELEKRAQLC